jgi:hypothetical protein
VLGIDEEGAAPVRAELLARRAVDAGQRLRRVEVELGVPGD